MEKPEPKRDAPAPQAIAGSQGVEKPKSKSELQVDHQRKIDPVTEIAALEILVKEQINEAKSRADSASEALGKLNLSPDAKLGFDKAIAAKLQQDLEEAQRLLAAEKALREAEKKAHATKPRTLKQMFAEISPSVPIVYAHDSIGLRGTGTGFLIKKGDQYLVGTNRHVVKNASKGIELLFLKRRSGSDYDQLKVRIDPDQVVGIHKSADFAILDVTAKRKEIDGFQTQPIPRLAASDYEYAEGDDVFVIGHPGAGNAAILKHSLAVGVVSGVRRTDPSVPGKYLQITAAVNPGNSGGPVFSSDGVIIGVASYILRWSPDKKLPLEGLNFALEISHVHELVESKDNSLATADILAFMRDAVGTPEAPQVASGNDKLLALSDVIFDQFAKLGFTPYTGTRKTSAVPFHMAPNGDYYKTIINRQFAQVKFGVLSEGSGDIGLSVVGPVGNLIVTHPGLLPDPMVTFFALNGSYSIGVHNFRNTSARCVLILVHDAR
jgi:S1-C subfamily serine protease